jgi:uncharacterized membrane protein YcaP (DUF421 family)
MPSFVDLGLWGRMLTLQVPVIETVLRTVAVYLAILFGLRLTGKREVGQLTPFDLVVILLIANAVQNAMVGPDTSLTGGLVAAAVLLAINAALARTRARVSWLRRAVEGTPTLLVHDGQLLLPALTREGIDADEVLMAIREHGLDDLAAVRSAILETDGSISVVPESDSNAANVRRRRTRQRRHN